MEEVRVLSNNLSAEISGWQYDTKIMEKYDKEYERIQRQQKKIFAWDKY